MHGFAILPTLAECLEGYTKDQIDIAKRRMVEETSLMYEDGYQGDWGLDFKFTIRTYNKLLWEHLFLSEEEYQKVRKDYEDCRGSKVSD